MYSITKNVSLNTKVLAFGVSVMVLLSGLLFLASKASADQSPGGCTAPGVSIFLSVFCQYR